MTTGIDRIGALSKAFEFTYKSETDGEYFEFGVYQGLSMIRAIKSNAFWRDKTQRDHVKGFFGFDSFEGLPAFRRDDHMEGYEVFSEGQFNDTSVEQVRERIDSECHSPVGVTLFPGWFSDSLTSSDTLAQLDDVKVAIAHIDCDLYSSAIECLNFLSGRLVDGAVVLFDDWFCYRGRPDRGVNKAFNEWIVSSGYTATEYFNYSWAGKTFILNIADE